MTSRENVLSPQAGGRRGGLAGMPDGCLRLLRAGPTLYAGGESETAKNLIAAKCDAYLMHGDPPETLWGSKIADMRERRRERLGLGPMTFGVAGYAIVQGLRGRGG